MKLREIERLRAAAILMVMTHHWVIAHAVIPRWLQGGAHGVDLFFVISGFVVTRSLLRSLPIEPGSASFAEAFERAAPALRAFFARRFFRIAPLVVVLILLHRVLIARRPDVFGSPAEWRDESIAVLSTVYNYAKALRPKAEFNQFGVYWSLCVEEHFYLTLPMLLLAFRTTDRRVGAAATIIALIVFVVRPMAFPEHQGTVEVTFYETFSSHLRFDSLFAGVIVALLLRPLAGVPILPRWLLRFVLLPAALLVIWTLPNVLPPPAMTREGFVVLWFFSGILVAFASLDRGYVLNVPVLGRVLEYIGARSYALYLVHVEMGRIEGDVLHDGFPAYAKLTGRADVRFWCLFLATIAVAEILHRGVERPFIRLGRRLARRVDLAPVVAAST